MPKQVFVSPFNGDWKVKSVGADRAAGIFNTKSEAVERARELSKNQRAEMSVQNRDGKISWKNSYGNDPVPPRG
jgi:hypothetical protein